MRMMQLFRVWVVILSVGAVGAFAQPGAGAPPQGGGAPGARRGGGPGMGGPALALTTSAFADGTTIPAKYAGQGAVSPALEWTNAPKDTAAFVLILHDPDVALRKGLEDVLHWILINIPGTATGLAEGVSAGASLPDGTMQLKNIMGANSYVGPGAPPGPNHHYTFELYALDKKLEVSGDATRADVLKAMDGHILGKAAYVGLFHR
jgi:Raf kinase inhibitor-like YbhB/YbcL family protein